MRTVSVLLSTYNGQKYLEELLDSVLHQKGVLVQLIIRDDGSSDSTIQIIQKYASQYPNITFFLEENVGCETSFELLTRYASSAKPCDYYAYCDQDDVWFPEKLLKSISAIEPEQCPCMYCCNQMITDKDLKPLGLLIPDEKYEIEERRLNNNYFLNRHGCTMVWNRALQVVFGNIKHHIPLTPGHDSWAMLVARCAGKVVVGKEPLMFYRVHGNNTGGYERNVLKRIKKGYNLYLKQNCHRYDFAKDCLFLLESKKERKQTEGALFVRKVALYKDSFFKRLALLCSKQIWDYGRGDSFLYALSVIIGNY